MTDNRVMDEAIAWQAALAGDDADWDGFTSWLSADAAHREAYDSVALLDDRIVHHREALATILGPEQAERALRRWWAWGGGGAIAAVAATGLFMLAVPQPADMLYRTGPGETRRVALADGSSVQLAPSSELKVQDDGAQLALEGGASFDIRHRPERVLTVQAGGISIKDIGTRFDVSTGERTVRVAVDQGQVTVDAPELDNMIRLSPGKRVIVDRAHGVAEVARHSEYASWRHGRLVYDNAPLALVAAEVGRYSGHHVTLGPGLADRRFSGVLRIGNGSGLVGDLARVMDLEVRDRGATMQLAARHSGT